MALLVVLFIVVPIAELYVIIQVGGLIGVWPTLALLLADALLGSFLLRHQGRGAWRKFNEAIAARRFPGREVADGAMIVDRRHPAADPGLHHRHLRPDLPVSTDPGNRQAPRPLLLHTAFRGDGDSGSRQRG